MQNKVTFAIQISVAKLLTSLVNCSPFQLQSLLVILWFGHQMEFCPITVKYDSFYA